VDDLAALLKPTWGSEPRIREGWNDLSNDEKDIIRARMSDMFQDGLPFELKHEKILYIYLFSLMAQLEVAAIQLPLQFGPKLKNPDLKARMRLQLLDEIFHAMAFTKTVYLLSEPYAYPPKYNEHIEAFCTYIRDIKSDQVRLVVSNIVGEGMIEEVFEACAKAKIASQIFDPILEDENRHVEEADLYAEIGLPDKDELAETVENLEKLFLTAVFMQPKYIAAMTTLLGPKGSSSFIDALYAKHLRQLNKINITPNQKWELGIEIAANLKSAGMLHAEDMHQALEKETDEIEMSPTQKLMMIELNAPGNPTMSTQFDVDVGCFFDAGYPSEWLTPLLVQSCSQLLAKHDAFRNYLSHNKLYREESAFVCIAEKVPGCEGHTGTIYFKDCHNMALQVLMARMHRGLEMMAYCYQKREAVALENPQVKKQFDDLLYEYAHDLYPPPAPGKSGAYITDLGQYGYTQAVSPLFKNIGIQVLLLSLEQKQVWNQATQSFETKTVVPISISADTRVFDGFLPIPQLFKDAFQDAFQRMQAFAALDNNHEEEQNTFSQESFKNKAVDDFVKDYHILEKVKRFSEEYVKPNAPKAMSGSKWAQKIAKQIEKQTTPVEKYQKCKNIADTMLSHYLGFSTEKASQDAEFEKAIDLLLAEDIEMGYRVLCALQTSWVDYAHTEEGFNEIYQKVSKSRLEALAKFIPKVVDNPLEWDADER